MTVQEALMQLAVAIDTENEGFLSKDFTLNASGDSLQITVVRKRRNGKVVVRKMGRLDEMSDPYALQGSGTRCPSCGGSPPSATGRPGSGRRCCARCSGGPL